MLFQCQAPSPAVQSIFEPLSFHLTVPSILAGLTEAPFYVDDPVSPQAAATWYHHKLFLAGRSDRDDFNTALGALLREKVFPAARARGQELYLVFSEEPGWREALPTLFQDSFQRIVTGQRQYYEWIEGKNPIIDPSPLPEGFWLAQIDTDLLAESKLLHVDYLREETQSERSSVEDFLQHSFGVCLRTRDSLTAWCLSEYNLGPRCEVGIATVEEHQRRGFGKAVGTEFLRLATQFGYTQIGWHCWTRNEPSSALARSVGYELVCNYEVAVCLFE